MYAAFSLVVFCTGFEPVTSALSRQRSKPTELTERVLSSGRKSIKTILTGQYFSRKIAVQKKVAVKLSQRPL